jgi:hypothetical protein
MKIFNTLASLHPACFNHSQKRFFFRIFYSFIFLLVLQANHLAAQQTIVAGKVTDAITKEGIPFANLIFLGTNSGTTTDIDGNYRLTANGKIDSLQVSYLGYKKKVLYIKAGATKKLNIALNPEAINLQELVVYSKGNPALELLKKVTANRDLNDKRNLTAYEYERYTKIEIDLNNLDSAKKDIKLVQKAVKALEKLDSLPGREKDITTIPQSITETISRVYYRHNPEIRREDLLKTKTFGVGFPENSWLSQVMITSLQQYNFYENWVTIMTKNFISPIATSGSLLYDYYLADSLYIGNDFCYKVECTPKSEQDLAFNGVIWITKKEYALRKIDATISERANLNYIRTIHIQQELSATAAGPWLPTNTKITIDSEKFGDKPGLLIHSLISQKDIKVNEIKPSTFYSSNLTVAEDANDDNEQYWVDRRHIALSEADSSSYTAIQTLKDEPTIKLYTKLFDSFFSTYYKFKKFEVGPYLYSYANNTVENHRFRMGIKTNPNFSRKWSLRAYSAYGTRDKKVKYGLDVEYLPSRLPWTQINFHHSYDLSQIGIVPEEDKEIYFFHAASLFGDLSRAYYYNRSSFTILRQLPFGVMTKVGLRHEQAQPLFEIHHPQVKNESVPPISSYTTTEAGFEVRFARDESFVQKNNRRVSLGMGKWPVFLVKYTLGMEGPLGGNYNYHKINASIDQRMKMGVFGKSIYILSGGYIFSQLPYPLLNIHLGNNSLFYYKKAFNTMSRYEFISDHFVALQYSHFFEGFVFNRIPLIKKLGWRLLASANIIYGGTRKENRSYRVEDGEYVPEFGFLEKGVPFAEVGYGIENIFKFIRIDAFHRLTYLNNPGISPFSVKVGFQVKF